MLSPGSPPCPSTSASFSYHRFSLAHVSIYESHPRLCLPVTIKCQLHEAGPCLSLENLALGLTQNRSSPRVWV